MNALKNSINQSLPTVANTGGLSGYIGDLEKNLKFSQVLLKSGLVPKHFQTPEAVYVALLWGQELGFSPVQATQSIEVIQGRVTLPANTIKALVLSHGGTISTVDWDSERCTLEMTRGEVREQFTYTTEDAKQAELLGKDNWKKNRKAMLYARCVSTLGRNMYADILKGIYSKEEMQDAIDVTPPRPIKVQLHDRKSEIKKAVTEALGEDDIVIEPEAEAIRIYRYDLTQIDMEKRDAAMAYIMDQGAVADPTEDGMFVSDRELPKLANALVRP